MASKIQEASARPNKEKSHRINKLQNTLIYSNTSAMSWEYKLHYIHAIVPYCEALSLISKQCPQHKVARLLASDAATSLNSELTVSAVVVATYSDSTQLQSPHLVTIALVHLLLDLVAEPPIRLPRAVERSPGVPLVSFPADPRFVPTCFKLIFLRPLVLKLIRMVFQLLKESTFETKPYVPHLVLAVVVGNV
jgi:hypothetical protein